MIQMIEISNSAVSVPPQKSISVLRFSQGSPFEALASSRLPVRMCRKGTLICTQGDALNCLYIVQKGTVLLSRLSAHGHETIIEFIRPGDFFGEVPMLTGNIARFNALALQPTILLVVRSGEFKTLLENPEACKALIGVLARRCEDAWTQIEALGGGLLEERLRVILSWLCSKMGVRTVEGIQINVTQSQLAQMVGATRESLNRQISVLKNQGIIGIVGGSRRACVLVRAPRNCFRRRR